MWGESMMSSCCFHVWCKSRELGGRGSSRFPCVTSVLESFSSDIFWAITSYRAESHLESCQISTMELSCENNPRLEQVDYFCKKLHRRCSTGPWMCFWLKVSSMQGMSGLQVYWICSSRPLYSEVVEARSNSKKSYFWWFRNRACGDSIGSNFIE